MIDINNIKYYTYCRIGKEEVDEVNKNKKENGEKNGKRNNRNIYRESTV